MFNTVMIVLGLIVAMGGVGGVDVSPDLTTMLSCTAVSVVGVVMMWIGTAGINADSDRYLNYNMKRR